MHLVDTSVWIEFLRKSGNPTVQARLKPLVAQGRTALTEWIVLELMTGLGRNERAQSLIDRLAPLERLPFAESAWARAWDLASTLRKRGVSPSAADCYIATVALDADVPLIHCDRDFEAIRRHSALRTIDWSPLLA